MMRTFSLLACTSLVALLVSCERPADTKNPTAAPPSSPPASAPKPADPGKDPMGDIKKATSSTSEAGKEVGAVAKDMAKDLDPNAVLSPDMTPEKLKENVKTIPTDKLTSIADKIAASLEGAAAPGGALEGAAKAAGLGGNLTALKEKLKVVVDELKARGIDVSKYSKYLGV